MKQFVRRKRLYYVRVAAVGFTVLVFVTWNYFNQHKQGEVDNVSGILHERDIEHIKGNLSN